MLRITGKNYMVIVSLFAIGIKEKNVKYKINVVSLKLNLEN